MKKQRKKSDLTLISPPVSTDQAEYQVKNLKPGGMCSPLSHKSKYSSTNKLTKSQLFITLSRKDLDQRT